MEPLSRSAIRDLDRRAVERLGLPSIVLMENAGKALAAEAARRIRGLGIAEAWVLCGKGNNGGDGFAAARHLLIRGIAPRVVFLGPKASLEGGADPAVNARALERLGCPVEIAADDAAIRALPGRIPCGALVVDAILGTGLESEVRPPLRSLFEALNDRDDLHVLAADVPSGLDADTGAPLGAALRAAATVTFAAPKRGFAAPSAAGYTGEIIVADIGVPVSGGW